MTPRAGLGRRVGAIVGELVNRYIRLWPLWTLCGVFLLALGLFAEAECGSRSR
jgi:hypothetical protein